jgi:hypothetical protein
LVFVGVFFDNGDGKTQLCGDISGKHGIVFSFLAPKVVVQMGNMEGKTVGVGKSV